MCRSCAHAQDVRSPGGPQLLRHGQVGVAADTRSACPTGAPSPAGDPDRADRAVPEAGERAARRRPAPSRLNPFLPGPRHLGIAFDGLRPQWRPTGDDEPGEHRLAPCWCRTSPSTCSSPSTSATPPRSARSHHPDLREQVLYQRIVVRQQRLLERMLPSGPTVHVDV